MRSRLVATLLTASALAACLACGDSTGPSTGITGTWLGSSLLPNGFTTTMVLDQSGSNVTGTLRIAGVLGTKRPMRNCRSVRAARARDELRMAIGGPAVDGYIGASSASTPIGHRSINVITA